MSVYYVIVDVYMYHPVFLVLHHYRSKNKIKVRNPEDIPFPPMPTTSPTAFIEKLNPEMLAKLRESQVEKLFF